MVARWSTVGFLLRLGVLGATGIAWSVLSIQTVLFQPDYLDPASFADFFAIWGFSAAWLLTAGSLLIVREVARGDDKLRRSIVIVAMACTLTGVANGLEDGFEMAALGTVYVVSVITSLLGMLVLAVLAWRGEMRRLTFVPGIAGLGTATMVIGGGVLALIAWFGFGILLWRSRGHAP